jgi:hypothetical protein
LSYYNALDRGYYGTPENDIEESIGVEEKPWNIDLGPEEIGTSLNPFQHQLQALDAKIKEGASKVEFEFFGAGKGNKERATPESFDKDERRQMRELAEINKVKSSTHATVAVEGLAGFNPQRGFDEQARDQSMKEVEKAIDFAAEATTGGAIVLHTGEWQRPIVDSQAGKEGFKGYEREAEKAPILVVDKRTGDIVSGIRKDTPIYEPDFKTIADYEQEKGIKLVGTKDKSGNIIESDDWIGVDDEIIKKDWEFNPNKAEEMFRRVPKWSKSHAKFKTVEKKWGDFVEKAENWNKKNPEEKLTPEELFAKTQYMNKILQAKGSSLFHGQNYEREKEIRDEAKKALEFYKQLEDSLSEEEKKKLMTKKNFGEFIPPKNIKITDYLKHIVKSQNDSMRFIHESSAAADVQATQTQEAMENVTTVKNYGLEKSAKSLAKLGIKTWNKNEQNKEHLQEDLYIAPENWHPNQFGSHPDEMIELVEAGREEMVKELTPRLGKEKAEELSKKHIRSTFDTGHLNLWKKNLEQKQGESDKEFDKRFSKWALGKVKKLHEKGILGHFHLSDNMGYDDEHLTIGKGNAPVKEMVEFLKDKGYTDFIAEPGSFNSQTIMPETWSKFGSPVYGLSTGHPTRFSGVHQQHFGYQAPPLYIVGAYSPSNDWKLWSDVPLE